MTIYEIKCRFCGGTSFIDSRKHMYKRFESNGNGSDVFVMCQCCNQLNWTDFSELFEVTEPNYRNGPVHEEKVPE